MTKQEFMKYVEQKNINLKEYNFVIGEKSNVPYTIGCYQEGAAWKLYEVGERQNFTIIRSGTEEEIFAYLYLRLRGIVSL